MKISGLIFSLSINDFAVSEYKGIVEKIEHIEACTKNPDVHADCKNILEQYLDMNVKTGEPYVCT